MEKVQWNSIKKNKIDLNNENQTGLPSPLVATPQIIQLPLHL